MDSKMPFYNLLNMFLTGLIFTGCCLVLFNNIMEYIYNVFWFVLHGEYNYSLETVVTIIFCAIIYEVGFIINRIGSLLENILKLVKAIPFDNDYKKFNEKKKEFPIMEILSREYALSRTSMTLFMLLAIVSIVKCQGVFIIITLVLTMLFYLSMRKHASKIVKLMR